MKSPIALLESLCSDMQRLNPGVKGLKRDIKTLEQRFENEGYGFLTVALPALDEALIIGLSTGKFTCPVGFKRLKGGTIPLLFSGMFCKVFDPFTGILIDEVDFGFVKGLHNLLRVYKKTQLSPENEELLHSKAVNEFYQCDDTASRVIIPSRHDHLIGHVCKLILNTLNSKDVKNAKYKHGPGAVKEGYSSNGKYVALFDAVRSDDAKLWPYLPDGASAWEHYSVRQVYQSAKPNVLHENEGATDGRIQPVSEADWNARLEGRDADIDRASRSSARLISVPKNSTSRRTITVEPAIGQFVQQGLNILLRDSINECRILSNCIALTDQSKNQKLALEGSRDRKSVV